MTKRRASGRSRTRAALTAILTALGLATLQASAEPANAWRFWEELDGIIEEQQCHCDGPLENLSMTFQGERLYLVSEVALSAAAGHVLTVRIDANPALDVALRMINSHLFAVDPGEQLSSLIEQFSAGASYSLRAASLSSIEGSQGSLVGFKSAYESFKNCRSAQ